MNKPKKLTTKKVIMILVAFFVICGCVLGGVALARNRVKKVATDEEFTYVNPDETKAETDEGFSIDGTFDEAQYKDSNWLYLHNKDESSDVDVAMTSYFGEKGMYFAYDVTDRNPIYVNLERNSPLNSCIEMYIAPHSVTSNKSNHLFEIDMMPTGDMAFKKTNGKGGYENITTSNDIMAYLGTTTKGGEVNTEECTGYTLELFIPWGYMEKFGVDTQSMKDNFVYVNPAHITAFNLDGTDSKTDRYWYPFAEQQGGTIDLVYQFFRFNANGAIGTTPTNIAEGTNCSVTGDPAVLPGMKTTYTITPEEGYAVNSVLVNGKEKIQNVDYNEDGVALLTVFGKTEGLEIKATAEPVTDGNKTLSGTVKIDGDSLKNVSISYAGTNGIKTISLDKNGKFTESNLQQGYYTITVEKEGYDKIERSIYLNRDITTELEFVAFKTTTGKSWIEDEQEDGVLRKFGGRGIVLSKANYNNFTVDVNLKFDEELAKEYDHTYFTQQRQGIRIKFSNGKAWDVNIFVEKGIFKVEYPAFEGKNSVSPTYRTVYHLTQKEIDVYTSKNGVQLKVIRDGKYANVLLNDKLIAVEILDDEYAKCTAQVGFSAWAANRVAKEYKYNITASAKNIKKQTYFDATGGWDISTQYDGSISMQKGGNGSIKLTEQYGNIDLTIKARDYQNSTDKEGTYPKTDVLFVFENGAHVSLSVDTWKTKSGKVYYGVRSINRVADDGKQIYNRWKDWGGHFTAEEIEKYLGEGIDFRVVRSGTKIFMYVGDRQMANVVDLTNNNSGVTANMKAQVSIRHFDDAGVEVVIPFKITTDLNTGKIESVAGANGTVVPSRDEYLIGDEITLTGQGKDGYYCKTMKVNGKDVVMNYNGTYTFTATEKIYKVEGTYGKRVFATNSEWDSFRQDEGVVSLPNGGGSTKGALETAKQYTNVDIQVTAREYAAGSGKARTDIGFIFENGSNVTFSIIEDSKTAWVETWNYDANNGGKLAIYKQKHNWGTLTVDEKAAYDSDAGVQFRIVRYETNAYIYIGERFLASADLTNNSSGVTADMKVKVRIRHFDDKNVEVVMPFVINDKSDEVEKVKIESVIGENGKVTPVREGYFVGDIITLKGDCEDGYYCKTMKVNGKDVVMNYDGTYTFTATEKSYKVEGTFAKRVFVTNTEWDTFRQDEGVVSLPNGGGSTKGALETAKQYTNVDIALTVREYAAGSGKGRTDIGFMFENGSNVSFSIIEDSSKAWIESWNYDANNGGKLAIYQQSYDWGTLTVDERTAYKSDTGIQFRVVRYGTDAYIYIGNRLLAVADLTNNSSGVTASTKVKVRIRHFDDKNVQVEIPFTISNTVDKVNGNMTLSQAKGTNNSDYVFANAVTDMDLTVQVQRHAAVNQFYERTDVLLEFSNGKHVSFGLVRDYGKQGILNYNKVADDDATDGANRIYNRGTVWGHVNDAEETLYQNGGVNFRIVRDGTDVLLYIGNRYVATADLTNNNSGVTADTKMKVTVRHYGNAGAQVDVPFEMTTAPAITTIKTNTSENGAVIANKEKCIVGDTVVLTVAGESGYYCNSLKVNNQEVTYTSDGTYTLVTTENSYRVSATFAEGLFEPSTEWDLSKVNKGIVSLTNGGGTTAGALRFTEQFTNVDITLTAREYAAGSGKGRTDIGFIFENGSNVSFSIYEEGTRAWVESWNYSGYKAIYANSYDWGDLTAAEKTAYDSDTGVQFRVVRYGTDAYIYIGERLLAVADLTNNSSGVTASTKIKVRIRHFDDKNVQVEIPFTISNIVGKLDGIMSLSQPSNADNSALVIASATTDIDLTIHAKRNSKVNNQWERTDILLEFANGKHVSFGLKRWWGKQAIVCYNKVADNDATDGANRIYNRAVAQNEAWYTVTNEEEELFQNGGIDFRIKREGTNILLYIGDKHVATADLTNNNSGVTADTKMKVTVRYFGNKGETVGVPFEIKTEVPSVAPANFLKNNFILRAIQKLVK